MQKLRITIYLGLIFSLILKFFIYVFPQVIEIERMILLKSLFIDFLGLLVNKLSLVSPVFSTLKLSFFQAVLWHFLIIHNMLKSCDLLLQLVNLTLTPDRLALIYLLTFSIWKSTSTRLQILVRFLKRASDFE